jgi:hypothetical protein
MKKQYVGMGVLVLVVVVAGWYFVSLNEPKAVPVVTPAPVTTTPATTTEVATGTTSAPTTPEEIGLDLSKLQGKDRLYTEEEGKYENLSEEERRLLLKSRCNVQHLKNHSQYERFPERRVSCNENNSGVQNDRLVSLNNNAAVIYGPSGAEMKGWVYIYNIEKDQVMSDVDHGNYAFGHSVVIRQKNARSDQTSTYVLELFRPGMEDFIEIPESTIPSTLSYMKWLDFISYGLPIEFKGGSITATVFRHDCDKQSIVEFGHYAGIPTRCTNIPQEVRSFKTSNLP